MHEDWLQRYIRDHYRQMGFTQIHGPYEYGADFKGFYTGKPVKIEAEWDYSDYISHKHSLEFADVLVVANLAPVPVHLKDKLPAIIIHLSRRQVIEWANPRLIDQNKKDYCSYPWRRLSRSLLQLYAHCAALNHRKIDFMGCHLVFSVNKAPTPTGFQFGSGGREETFTGLMEDKVAWDYWLIIAHSVASHFRLKPALLRPTWIDRVSLYFTSTGKITEGELNRFKDIALFIDELFLRGEP